MAEANDRTKRHAIDRPTSSCGLQKADYDDEIFNTPTI